MRIQSGLLVLGMVGLVGLVGFAGCIMPSTNGNDNTTMRLQFDGLEALGQGFVYEGWLIVGGAPVSTGRFSLTADNAGMPMDFEVSTADAQAATTFVLTIEPEVGDDPAPADTHVLAGPFSSDMADLTVGSMAALGTDFSDAAGAYILQTPSTGDIADDFDQGVWFLDPAAGEATLMLPTLPAGWMYEGWIVDTDGPISTGRFTAVDMADSDGAGPASGMDAAPPFPGQDFIDPARMLVGKMVVISVEPEPDDSGAPFALKPLVDTDVDDVDAGVLQDLMNNAEATNPTGTAMFVMN